MIGEDTFQADRGRRSLFGLLIVGAHAGVIALVTLSMRVSQLHPEPPPVTVVFVEQAVAKLDPPLLSDPRLVSITPPATEVPDVAVETEVHTEVTSTLQVAPTPASVVAAAVRSGDSTELRSMSEVAYLEPPAPRYPLESKRAREEGLVILKVLIDESGHASSIHVFRSSGHPRLDEAACHAVQRARFKPYLDGGIARTAIAMVPVEFSLHGAGDRGPRSSG
jgi:protein TonB